MVLIRVSIFLFFNLSSFIKRSALSLLRNKKSNKTSSTILCFSKSETTPTWISKLSDSGFKSKLLHNV